MTAKSTANYAVKSALSVRFMSMNVFYRSSNESRSFHRTSEPRAWLALTGVSAVGLLIIVFILAAGAGVMEVWEEWLFADDLRVFGALLVGLTLLGLFVVFVRVLMMEGRRHRDWVHTIQELEREREARRDAEQALYAMAHDLKAPLVTLDYLIDGFIRDRPEDRDEQVLGDALRCREVVEDMDMLVKQMLEFGNGVDDAGRTGHVWVASAVGEAVKMLKPNCEAKGAHVRVEPGPDVGLRLPPEDLRVVLVNLLDNALKYGPDADAQVRVSWYQTGRSRRDAAFVLEVADNGKGVPYAERERVFKMLTRLPDPDGRDLPGSGIGLARVRRMVLRQKGHVEISDAPEGGALFRVVYPASCLESPGRRQPAATPSPPAAPLSVQSAVTTRRHGHRPSTARSLDPP